MPDSILFFRAWLGAPLRVASVTPSGTSLARLMTSEIRPGDGPVLELGPGTGVFTRALLQRGIPASELTLVEAGAEFAALLRQRYPDARVLGIDADRLHAQALHHTRPHGAAISGLPLLSMPPAKVFRILSGSFAALGHGASLYQFTYGPRCPVPPAVLRRLRLGAARIGSTMANLPPATVWRLSPVSEGLRYAA